MSALNKILDTYQTESKTEREKGAYFKELTITHLRNETTYKDLYSDVWIFNDWKIETKNKPKYTLELLQRVITVSLENMKIVNNLPKLDID